MCAGQRLITLWLPVFPDNRNARRVTCRAKFLGASATVVRGDILDVSQTGLCLQVDTVLERGRELHLEFELAAGRVEAVGEVRWVVAKDDRIELGIRFSRISSESLAVIAQATSLKAGGFWRQTVFRR